MGDPEANVENEVLATEQDLQVGRGSHGDVTILPTLVINNVQYRGKLERTAVLKAVCAGFKETTDHRICLNGDLETNECLDNNGGCWKDPHSNIAAYKDTFRGRVCQCPVVNGVQYKGDGYTVCKAVGPGRCMINNGGCWLDTRYGQRFSAFPVDLQEPICHFLDAARVNLAPENLLVSVSHKATNFYCLPLQTVHQRFCKCLLKLSGNNAIMVMDDTDIEIAVRSVLVAAVGTAGQHYTTCRRLEF